VARRFSGGKWREPLQVLASRSWGCPPCWTRHTLTCSSAPSTGGLSVTPEPWLPAPVVPAPRRCPSSWYCSRNWPVAVWFSAGTNVTRVLLVDRARAERAPPLMLKVRLSQDHVVVTAPGTRRYGPGPVVRRRALVVACRAGRCRPWREGGRQVREQLRAVLDRDHTGRAAASRSSTEPGRCRPDCGQPGRCPWLLASGAPKRVEQHSGGSRGVVGRDRVVVDDVHVQRVPAARCPHRPNRPRWLVMMLLVTVTPYQLLGVVGKREHVAAVDGPAGRMPPPLAAFRPIAHDQVVH